MVRLHNVRLPLRYSHVIFILPMPKSWSKKKKSQMCDMPHEQTPDWDNLGKALSDAVYDDDKKISDIRISKVWGYEGGIIIKLKEKNHERCNSIIRVPHPSFDVDVIPV